MIHGTDAKLHNGRLYVALFDQDGRDVYFHGVVIAPANITEENVAEDTINSAYTKVRYEHPDDWNFGEVIDALKLAGWEHIACATWVE